MSAICSTSYKEIDLVLYPYCTLIMTIEVQFHKYSFLPHEHHLAGSGSQPESSTTLKVKIMLEISITQFMVMLDLLTNSWLCQQLLVQWCVPNNHQCSIHSKQPTMQCLPPSVVMQLQIKELKFDGPALAHKHN